LAAIKIYVEHSDDKLATKTKQDLRSADDKLIAKIEFCVASSNDELVIKIENLFEYL